MASRSSSSNGDEDQLDPRIKGELEALNSAAESINKLENEIQKAKVNFKRRKAECQAKLKSLSNKIGRKLVSQTQPYYETIKSLNKQSVEAHKAAARFQKASSVYKAAQETVYLAEQQLVGEDGAKLEFDGAWQEMLNHATCRFTEAEQEKRSCEEEHEKCSKECSLLQQRLMYMQGTMSRAIAKSKPFYDLKDTFEKRLQVEKQNAEDLQLALVCSKQKYKLSLINLEQISEEIHMQRSSDLPKRTPGVGAESDTCSEFSEMLSINLDFLSDTSSQVSKDDLDSDICLDNALNYVGDDSCREDGDSSGNPLDNFFNKMSKKFNRSNSLGNLNSNLNLQLQIQDLAPADGSSEEGRPGADSTLKKKVETESANVPCREHTLEGAEQTPQSEFLEAEHFLRERSSPYYFPQNKMFVSSVYLSMSHSTDKIKRSSDIPRDPATSESSHPSSSTTFYKDHPRSAVPSAIKNIDGHHQHQTSQHHGGRSQQHHQERSEHPKSFECNSRVSLPSVYSRPPSNLK